MVFKHYWAGTVACPYALLVKNAGYPGDPSVRQSCASLKS